MSKLSSVKYEGTGNDFLLIDDRSLQFPTDDAERIRRLCCDGDVDGLLLLQPSAKADFRMRIFNSDGGEAEGCGNGLRCITRFLSDLGIAKERYRIAIGVGIAETYFVGERVAVRLENPKILKLHLPIGKWTVHSVDTGVPHAVIFVPDAKNIDLSQEAPFVRHSFPPRGANVDFVSVRERGILDVRTFERGVEGETLSCGTGAAAAAVIAAQVHNWTSPIQTVFPGGAIEVRFENRGLENLSILGPAHKMFSPIGWNFEQLGNLSDIQNLHK